jgi:two-component system, OmpR family, sensor histidine kinase KdpD
MHTSVSRPDPDALLTQLRQEGNAVPRGRLKVFVGAAPGVGKTYTMLETARLRQREGRDVVIGVVETHGRADTAMMTQGFEVLARRQVEQRGTLPGEFDLEAALRRRPSLILVDELAHSNAESSAHAKRWQDVEALLAAGIDVYSTMNVQHLESLNDVVAGITGVQVRETVPDAVLDGADEVELVDVSPEVLEERMRNGKVYAGEQAARALDRFFRRGNLIALRELALRRTAERVEAQMRRWRASAGVVRPWATAETVLVCVGPSPSATRLVRAARRLAGELDAQWSAVYVERPGDATLPAERRALAEEALRLAETLGGQSHSVSGHDVVDEVLALATRLNATRLLVAPTRRWWGRVLPQLTIPHRLLRRAAQLDVMVVNHLSPDVDEQTPAAREGAVNVKTTALPRTSSPPREYLAALLGVVMATGVGLLVRDRMAPINMAMALLLVLVFNATRYGRGATLAATTLAVLAFDVLFVPPYGTLAVSDARFVLTFVVMFVVGTVMSSLTRRVREQAVAARDREAHTHRLYTLTGELAAARTDADVVRVALHHLAGLVDGAVAYLEPQDGTGMVVVASHPPQHWPVEELAVARWCFDRQQPAGAGTSTLPASRARYLPIAGSGQTLGVIGLLFAPRQSVDTTSERGLLTAMVGQVAVALDRTRLADRARIAHLDAEAERLRNALLSSLSHDLRTPLGSVEGAASTLVRAPELSHEERRELAQTIVDESQRMTRLVANLLDMVRVESGALQVQREWHVLDEVVSGAVLRVEPRLGDRDLQVHLPDTLPLVALDDVLIQQVLVNLLENALRYTPAGSPIEITAEERSGELVVSVSDRGPGIAESDRDRIFVKFERGDASAGGIGLGLSICSGIVRAHGGRIWVESRVGGGASFRFALPLRPPPSIEPEALSIP